jgi:hypothetical protein
MIRFLSTLVAVAALAPSHLYADSDGYYCVGAGFIAVQFRSFNTPGLKAKHVLKLARFDKNNGPRWAGEVALEDFQPHTLSCGARNILIEGIGERGRGLVSYLLKVEGDSVRIVSHTSDPRHDFTNLPEGPPNIGAWAKPGVSDLPDRGDFPRFQLRVTRTSRREPGQVIHAQESILVELLQGGRLGRSLILHRGIRIETVD